jgi:hypothetical protein
LDRLIKIEKFTEEKIEVIEKIKKLPDNARLTHLVKYKFDAGMLFELSKQAYIRSEFHKSWAHPNLEQNALIWA